MSILFAFGGLRPLLPLLVLIFDHAKMLQRMAHPQWTDIPSSSLSRSILLASAVGTPFAFLPCRPFFAV